MTEFNKDDFMENAQGMLVPKSQIKPIDLLRNDVVNNLIAKAKVQSEQIKSFKEFAFDEIAQFISISAEQYNLKTKGKKGNVTLISFDGRYKIERAYADKIAFDEQLQIAKEKIYECIQSWSAGANSKLISMVNFAFQTDKKGQVSADRILGLRRLKIQDEKWLEAMMALSESITSFLPKDMSVFMSGSATATAGSPFP